MPKENIVLQAVLFASILFALLSGAFIAFVFLYQRKKYTHRQDMQRMEEVFTKEMLNSQIEIQEQTLRHIASEIHDNFNPSLSLINLNLGSILPKTASLVQEDIAEAKTMIKQLMAEMKMLSISLNTDHIKRTGFTIALEKYAAWIARSGAFKIEIQKNGDSFRIMAEKEIILFRMCQEILNNIVKHANADHIDILLNYQSRYFSICIKDNGVGFDIEHQRTLADEKDSTGLTNLSKRASVIDALLNIKSALGKGTTIKISVQT